MHHYYITVPSSGEVLTAKETIVSRLEYYNDCDSYLLFDGGNEHEKRFVMVTAKKMDKHMLNGLKEVFEAAVTAEAINIKSIDRMTLKKIHAAKSLMANNHGYRGEQKTLLVTDTSDRLMEKADGMIGYSAFKEFYSNYASYIDRTASIKAKCLYNTVFVNKCGICLDAHVELLYGMLATKGV